MPARALTAETKYGLLLEISHRLSGTLDLDEILGYILDTVQTVIDFDAAGIFVLAQEAPHPAAASRAQTIAGVSSRGFDQRPAEEDAMLRFGKGIVGHVIASSTCYLAPDVRQDPYYVDGRRSTVCEIAVPIALEGRTIGALNLESDTPGAYAQDDVEALQFFADAAAISIEKAMLHRHLLEKRRIEYQLSIAHDVQSRLLPREPPRVEGCDIAGLSMSCFEIGGDYFDYVPLSGNRLAIVIADVAGKGIAAALIMATFRAMVRIQAGWVADPVEVMQALNRQLEESIGPPAFVTAVYGVLDCATGHFRYANCGHNPHMVLLAIGSFEELRCGGPFLGVFSAARYEAGDVTLANGDVLLLYTDGVVEHAWPDGTEFGAARLAAVAHASRRLPAAGIIEAIVRATRQHTAIDTYQDDFTLMVVSRRPQPAGL